MTVHATNPSYRVSDRQLAQPSRPRLVPPEGSHFPGAQRARVTAPIADSSLALDRPSPTVRRPGTLIAVCGLHPEAGASTLAYLTASYLAQQNVGPILLCDADDSVGLSRLAQATSPYGLNELSESLTQGRLDPTSMFATIAPKLRLIATAGSAAVEDAPAAALTRILNDARTAHAATVIDCGRLTTAPARIAADLATHRVWITGTSRVDTKSAWNALARQPPSQAVELIVARRLPGNDTAPRGEIAHLATTRAAPLVWMPIVEPLDRRKTTQALETCQLTLHAITRFTRRPLTAPQN
jgi:hypothetical protein